MFSFCSLTAYFHSSYSNQPKPVGLKYLNNQQNEMRNGYVEKTHLNVLKGNLSQKQGSHEPCASGNKWNDQMANGSGINEEGVFFQLTLIYI